MGLFDNMRSDTAQQAVAPGVATRWSALPAAKSSLPVLKIKLWLVTGLVSFAALMGVFATIAWTAGAPEIDYTAVYPEGRGVAESAALDFLSGRKSVFPTGRGVPSLAQSQPEDESGTLLPPPRLNWRNLTWHGYESSRVALAGDGYDFETHRFLVVVDDQPHELTVVVNTTGDIASLGALPTLLPLATVGADLRAVDWQMYGTGDTPGAVRLRVNEWARAFVTDDRRPLKLMAGDGRAGVTYRGMSAGWEPVSDPLITGAVMQPGAQMWLRVRVPMERANGFTMTGEYDLLVGSVDTEAPTVLAWGPAGSAPTLMPWVNALPDEAVEQTP